MVSSVVMVIMDLLTDLEGRTAEKNFALAHTQTERKRDQYTVTNSQTLSILNLVSHFFMS